MNRANTIGMFISTSLIGLVLGAISGLIWSLSLNFKLSSGLIYGCISGFFVGFILFLFQKGATSSGNQQDKEMSFVSGSMMMIVFMISVVIAIVVGLVRWIF